MTRCKSKGLQVTWRPCCLWILPLREDLGLKQTSDGRASNLAVIFITHGQPTKHAAALQLISWLLQGTVQTRAFIWITWLLRAIVKVRTKCGEWLGCQWSTAWAGWRDRCMLWLLPFGKISLTTCYCSVVLGIRASWCIPSLVIFAVMSISMPKEPPKIIKTSINRRWSTKWGGLQVSSQWSYALSSFSTHHDESQFWSGEI